MSLFITLASSFCFFETLDIFDGVENVTGVTGKTGDHGKDANFNNNRSGSQEEEKATGQGHPSKPSQPSHLSQDYPDHDNKQGEVEDLGTLNRSQAKKARTLNEIYRDLEDGENLSKENLVNEAEAEGVSSDFVDLWLKDEGRAIS